MHGSTGTVYQAAFSTLVPQGYRLRWVQAYSDGTTPQFNSVWEQSVGPRWEAKHGVTAGEYQTHFDQNVQQGRRLRCVSAYLDRNSIRYATLWEQGQTNDWEARHGIPGAQYQQHFDGMVRRGFRLAHLNACGIGNDAVFATIWEQGGAGPWRSRHGLDATAYQREFDAAIRDGFRLRQVCAYAVGGAARYAAIWDTGNTPWQGRHGRDGEAYQLDFDDLRLGGYRPACVTACHTAQGDRFAAVFENLEFTGAQLGVIDREATGFMSRHSVPGLSIAFTNQGRLVYAQALGSANAARTETLRTKHRMRIASVSKPITAVAVYRLWQQNTIGLDDRVFGPGALLGTTYGTKPYSTNLKTIRVHHLLEHTSGAWDNQSPGTPAAPNPDDHDAMADPMFGFAGSNHTQLITQVLDTYPVDRPSSRYAYSNFGYCLIGRILEAKSGVGYERFVQQNVLQPAGITGMRIAGTTLASRQPWEVEYVGQGGENPYGPDVARMDAHGGWVATAIDLVRFAVHVNGIGGASALLTPAAVTSMLTASSSNARYARGWAVNAVPNRWHAGSLPGTRSLLVTASNGMSWSALCN